MFHVSKRANRNDINLRAALRIVAVKKKATAAAKFLGV